LTACASSGWKRRHIKLRNFILVIRARVARFAENLDDGVNRNICETCGRSD